VDQQLPMERGPTLVASRDGEPRCVSAAEVNAREQQSRRSAEFGRVLGRPAERR
jgi:hypothetical protein